jgi:hypothetical protein
MEVPVSHNAQKNAQDSNPGTKAGCYRGSKHLKYFEKYVFFWEKKNLETFVNENNTGFMVSVIKPGEHSIDWSWRLGRVAYGTQTLIKTDTIALFAPVGVEPFPKTSRGGGVGGW